MRALIQRVTRGSVTVDNEIIGEIGKGFVILLGVAKHDTEKDARYLAEKCVNLRIFEDEKSHFNHSLLDTGGEVLVVSQFTLYGDTQKGRRPGFDQAALPEQAQKLYDCFISELKKHPIEVAQGRFGAYMHVEIQNDGPVTFMVESKAKTAARRQ